MAIEAAQELPAKNPALDNEVKIIQEESEPPKLSLASPATNSQGHYILSTPCEDNIMTPPFSP